MIVSLDEIKRVLGITLSDTTEDDNLTRLILAATEWVQGQTHRRFDTPILTTEYKSGHGHRILYLAGHIDDSAAADNPSETLDPTSSVHVYRRPILEGFRDWEELIEGEDWERREDALVFIRAWQVWPLEDELKITYMDGYAQAPEDVKALILELAMNQYLLDAESSSGSAGITSESLGDFSYSVGTSAAGSTTISASGMRTLNYRTRKFV
jgi:gp6-like head-tail connector protein